MLQVFSSSLTKRPNKQDHSLLANLSCLVLYLKLRPMHSTFEVIFFALPDNIGRCWKCLLRTNALATLWQWRRNFFYNFDARRRFFRTWNTEEELLEIRSVRYG